MTNSLLLELYEALRDETDKLSFSLPVSHVYNPLAYAWHGFSQYLAICNENPRVVFLGMNPGPYGMAQTGIPFGEINSVKNFLGISEINITPPKNTHPSYPVNGLNCSRSEVSGKRLWQLFREKFTTANAFFREHIVLNYCPLLFIADGHNFTPDKLAKNERTKLFAICDNCLREAINILKPEHVVGIGSFAAKRINESSHGNITAVQILHPSPASPASNNNWAGKVTQQLIDSGVWQ